MKKILTASLVAIMAVTAANADIASTVYVDSAQEAAEATAKTYADNLDNAMDARVDKLEADNATNKSDITQLKTDNTTNKSDITQLKADVNALGTGAGSVANQINNKVGDLGTYGTVVEAIAGAEADAVATAGTNADTKINTLKGQMTLATVGGAGSFVQQVAQTNGTVTATATGFISNISDNPTSTIAPQTKAVKDYVDAQYKALGDINDENQSDIAQLESDLADVQASLTTGATKTAIDTAQAAAEAAQSTADAAVAKTTIGADANFAIPDDCKTANAVCSLVVRAGKAGWEKVVDSAPAAAAE